jgi:RNA polymerase sigma-70 factor (ECF subfamily)
MVESLRTDSSFSNAVNKHTDMLIRVAFSYTKNIIDAQDIVQEVFLKLLENNPVFVSDEHEKAWLIRVTVNLCRNFLKQSGQEGLFSLMRK